jgi:hypothetical protein
VFSPWVTSAPTGVLLFSNLAAGATRLRLASAFLGQILLKKDF